jgi:hypothetical protein
VTLPSVRPSFDSRLPEPHKPILNEPLPGRGTYRGRVVFVAVLPAVAAAFAGADEARRLADFSETGATLARADIRRDLRREALLRCSTPFSAALSRALMARRTSSLVSSTVSGTPGRRARETSVLTADRVARLRLRFRKEARTRFFAD